MDQGGKLYNHPEVRIIFKKQKYTIFPTGANTCSLQNSLAIDRAH